MHLRREEENMPTLEQIERYNGQAVELESKLREACPLLDWRVDLLATPLEPWKEQPRLEDLEYLTVRTTTRVNGHTLHMSTRLLRRCLSDAAVPVVDIAIHQMAREIGEAIIAWRPAAEPPLTAPLPKD
jgi:hypothetical protein